MIIAIDFDGTCVTHDYPKIGEDIGAIPVLKQLVANGNKLILYTMRSNSSPSPYDSNKTVLDDAVDWFKNNSIELYGINENPDQKSWTNSPKIYANLYIDDAGANMPLIYGNLRRPYVDWFSLSLSLIGEGILTTQQFKEIFGISLNHEKK